MSPLLFRGLYLLLFSCHLLTALAVSSEKKKNAPSENSHKTRLLDSNFPVVINTWHFIEAGQKAWEVLSRGGSALDAVEEGCTVCEELQCDGTVGYGGSPDENGETTLDAMIMDGETHDVGAVGDLRWVKNAISVARAIKDHTQHTLLVGSQATNFALSMGFPAANLTTPHSESIFFDWKSANCQPNFWKNVEPNPSESCGPYQPLTSRTGGPWNLQNSSPKPRPRVDRNSHDTIGMIAIDASGSIAGGTTTNGANHKIPGRVGDSPIPGSGAYVDKKAGGAAATGDGDVMMRFMPSLVAVEAMRQGSSPKKAAQLALMRIVEYYPTFSGALVTLSIKGEVGASCYNLPGGFFPYTVGTNASVEVWGEPCLEIDNRMSSNLD